MGAAALPDTCEQPALAEQILQVKGCSCHEALSCPLLCTLLCKACIRTAASCRLCAPQLL